MIDTTYTSTILKPDGTIETKTKTALSKVLEKSKPVKEPVNLPRITNIDYFNGDTPGRMAKIYNRLGEDLAGKITADNKDRYVSSAVKDLSEVYPTLKLLIEK